MIEGRYFPPGESRAMPARLWGAAGDLRLAVGDSDEVLHPRLAHLSDRLANVPRKFSFGDGAVFEAAPEADVDGFLDTHHSFFSRLSRLEANWRFVAVAAVVTIGLLFSIYRFGMPLAASAAAAVTPSVVSAAMERGTLETVERVFFSKSKLSEDDQARVHRLFDELVETSKGEAGLKGANLRVLLRDGGVVGANALALPGGTVIVTDQLVKLAKSDDEIAGVIAHEIGHVAGRHSLKQVYRVLGIGFMIGVIGGDASQIVDDFVTQASALQTLAYTRAFEAEADAHSVRLMMKDGRDPTAFVDLLDRMAKKHPGAKKTGWLSTHPGTEDRRDAVEKLAKELGWKG
ncbi:MAG: M48 family metallopeptidase [Salaquimonas sp.]|nr:M48 family metallopeptidase [Salaquimonas sp.]